MVRKNNNNSYDNYQAEQLEMRIALKQLIADNF